MTLNPTKMLPELDLYADGQLSSAEANRLRGEASAHAELRQELLGLERLHELLTSARVDVKDGFTEALSEALGAENAEHERFAQWLRREQIEVRPGFADGVLEAARIEAAHEGSVGELLAASAVDVRPGFADGVMAAVATEREAPCAVSAALAEARVDVRSGFADQVMARVRDEHASEDAASARAARWTVAGAAAAVLLLVGSMAVLSGAGDSGLGLLGMLGDFASMTLLAGAGMLGATWAGVGSTVDAWLGTSVANWAVALMLVAGLAFLCQRTVRKARVSIRRD